MKPKGFTEILKNTSLRRCYALIKYKGTHSGLQNLANKSLPNYRFCKDKTVKAK